MVGGRRHRRLPGGAALALFGLVVVGPGCPRRGARLPPKPDGASVVVAAGEAAGEAGFQMAPEIEPNDAIARAQALAPTAETGAGIVGQLVAPPGAKSKDVDLFRISIPPPAVVVAGPDGAPAPLELQQLRIELRPDAPLAVTLDVLDEQGKVVITSSGGGAGELQAIPNLAVTPGGPPVLVRVRSGAPGATTPGTGAGGHGDSGGTPTSGYRLTARLMPFGTGDEAEPNGKMASANDANLDGDVAGYLGWRRDEDWFRISTAGMPEGGVLSVELDALEGVAPSVAVYDSAQHKIIEQHGRKGDRVALRNVRLPPAEATVYVVVSADSGRNSDIRYSLHLKPEEPKADGEIEPNDDPAHAVPLVDGTVTGTLGPGDADVYRYLAAAPSELSFEVQPPPHVDVKVDVLREDGTTLMRVDAAKRGAPERLPNLFAAGAVFLRLQAAKGEGNLDEPYRVTVSSRPIEAGAEHEPNGTAALASPLGTGATGTGLIFPQGDVDFWSIGATPGSGAGEASESLGVAVRGISGMTLEIRVRPSSGKRELARFRAGPDVSAPTRVVRGTEGCCLLEIRELTGKIANPKDRYSVVVTP